MLGRDSIPRMFCIILIVWWAGNFAIESMEPLVTAKRMTP